MPRKEELLLEIEHHQCKLGDAGLLEEDKYLVKVNLEEMASSSGKSNIIGYSIQTVRNAKIIPEQRESQSTVRGNTTGE